MANASAPTVLLSANCEGSECVAGSQGGGHCHRVGHKAQRRPRRSCKDRDDGIAAVGHQIKVLRESLRHAPHNGTLGSAAKVVTDELKPSNIMLKRTGNTKITDPWVRCGLGLLWCAVNPCGRPPTPPPRSWRADRISRRQTWPVGLNPGGNAGRRESPFEGLTTRRELVAAETALDRRLLGILPEDVSCNELLLHLLRKAGRFRSSAALSQRRESSRTKMAKGPLHFHRQLVKYDWPSEYETIFACGWNR